MSVTAASVRHTGSLRRKERLGVEKSTYFTSIYIAMTEYLTGVGCSFHESRVIDNNG